MKQKLCFLLIVLSVSAIGCGSNDDDKSSVVQADQFVSNSHSYSTPPPFSSANFDSWCRTNGGQFYGNDYCRTSNPIDLTVTGYGVPAISEGTQQRAGMFLTSLRDWDYVYLDRVHDAHYCKVLSWSGFCDNWDALRNLIFTDGTQAHRIQTPFGGASSPIAPIEIKISSNASLGIALWSGELLNVSTSSPYSRLDLEISIDHCWTRNAPYSADISNCGGI